MRAAILLVACGLPLTGCHTFSFHKKPDVQTAAATKAAETATPAKPATKLTATARTGPASPSATAATSRTRSTSVRAATREIRVGEVRVIGSGRRFVLIEVAAKPGIPVLAPGLELRTRTSADGPGITGEQTGTLRVSPERRQPFIVADVIDGEPHVEDTVYYSAENITHLVPSILTQAPPPPEQAAPPPQPQATPASSGTSPSGYRATVRVEE